MDTRATEHPAVLNQLTTTQMIELFRQFDDGDRPSFDEHVASYALDRNTGNRIWDWLSADPTGDLKIPVSPDDHVRGRNDAPATLVVYGDYECPYTRRALQAITRLEHRIGDRFRLVYRHFPLRAIHPHAEPAAELAEAAADRGRFWEMHDRLFHRQNDLDPYHLAAYAAEFGISAAEFGIPDKGDDPGHFEAGSRCADRVEEDVQGGIRSGVDGTPAAYVNGWRHRGAYDEATLERAIELAR